MLERLWADEEELLCADPGDNDLTEGLKEAIAEDARRVIDVLVDMGALGVDGESLVPTPIGQWATVELLRENGYEPLVVD